MIKNERREFLKAALAAMGGAAGAGVLGCRWMPGAMCYMPAPPKPKPTPCPDCERTVIVGEKDEILNGYQVPLKRIRDQGIDARLSIPGHCPTCGFGLKEEKFQLEINYADRPEPTRIELDSASDLENLSLNLQRQDGTGKVRVLKRAELADRLKKLAASKAPKDLSPGAMCYSPAFSRDEKSTCPECQHEMQVGEMDKILKAYNIPLKRIQDHGVDAMLILPEHCPACGFGLETGKILVEIRYPDHPVPIRVEPEKPFSSGSFISRASELEIMALFLQGRDRYPLEQGREQALKDKVDRLRELFGIEYPQ